MPMHHLRPWATVVSCPPRQHQQMACVGWWAGQQMIGCQRCCHGSQRAGTCWLHACLAISNTRHLAAKPSPQLSLQGAHGVVVHVLHVHQHDISPRLHVRVGRQRLVPLAGDGAEDGGAGSDGGERRLHGGVVGPAAEPLDVPDVVDAAAEVELAVGGAELAGPLDGAVGRKDVVFVAVAVAPQLGGREGARVRVLVWVTAEAGEGRACILEVRRAARGGVVLQLAWTPCLFLELL